MQSFYYNSIKYLALFVISNVCEKSSLIHKISHPRKWVRNDMHFVKLSIILIEPKTKKLNLTIYKN